MSWHMNVALGGTAVAVAVGYDHTCALLVIPPPHSPSSASMQGYLTEEKTQPPRTLARSRGSGAGQGREGVRA